MDAEKLALRRRIDTLDQHATRLHATLTEYERENAQLKAELEIAKIQNQYISDVADAYEKDIEKLERERDALMHDLYFECYDSPHACYICKYGQNGVANCLRDLDEDDCFEWRGLCAENGGADE